MSETEPQTDPQTEPKAEPKEEVRTEEFQMSGDRVISEIKDLLQQGNIRRIILKNEEGKTLIEIPLTIGVVGVILLPVWAAIGAIAALAAKLTVSVERVEKGPPPKDE